MENRYKLKYDIKRRFLSDIRFMQGDTDSSALEVQILDNSVPIDISGEAIEFRFLKSDNTVVSQNSTNGVKVLDDANGIVECILKANTLAAVGTVRTEIIRKKDNIILTCPTFNFTVNKSIGNMVLSSNYIASIENKLIEWTLNEDLRQRRFESNENTREDKFNTNEVNRQAEFDSNETARESEYQSFKKAILADDVAVNLQNQMNNINENLDKDKMLTLTKEESMFSLHNAIGGYGKVALEGNTLVNRLLNPTYKKGFLHWYKTGTTYPISGNKVTVNATSTNSEHHIENIVNAYNVNHKYYARTYINSLNNSQCQLAIYYLKPDGHYANIFGDTNSTAGLTSILFIATEIDINPTLRFRIRLFDKNGTNVYAGTTESLVASNSMLIDLTETFGAGNEPTQEWCDSNIKFFEGIKSVGDTSKNIFNSKLEKGYYSTADGSKVQSNEWLRSINKTYIEANATYTISGSAKQKLVVLEYDKNSNYLGYTSGNPKTFTSKSNTNYVYIYSDDKLQNVQIEKGSQATEYESYYDNYKIGILSSGKNKFNINSKDTVSIDTDVEIHSENNSFTLTKTVSGSYNYWGVDLSHLKPNTNYNYSCIVEGNRYSGIRIFNIDTDVCSPTYGEGKKEKQFTTPNNTSKLKILFYVYLGAEGTIGEKATFKNVQIERGTTSTRCESFKQDKLDILMKEPLKKWDNIDENGVKNIGSKELMFKGNSDENWRYDSNILTNTVRFITDINNGLTSGRILSNNFKFLGHTTYDIDKENTQITTDKIFVRILKTKLTQYGFIDGKISTYSTAFKAYLADNNTTVIYQLAKPQKEQLKTPILNTFEKGSITINSTIPPKTTIIYPSNLASAVQSNNETIEIINDQLGNLWRDMLIVADKELQMSAVELLQTESTTEDIRNKVNEIIDIWKGSGNNVMGTSDEQLSNDEKID